MISHIGKKIALLLAAAACVACSPQATEVVPNAAGAGPLRVPQTGAELERLAKDRTFHFSFGSDGVQLEHFAASGDAYLWLPTLEQTIAGKWKVEESSETGVVRVCFRYATRSLFQNRRDKPDTWSCKRQSKLQEHVLAILEGDPFDLKSGTAPIVLPEKARWRTTRVIAATPKLEDIEYVYLFPE